MADARLQSLINTANLVHDRYRKGYAGRSRVGRDPSQLDGMIAELQEIKAKAGGMDGADELLGRLGEWEQLYRRERDEIRKVAEGGPDLAAAFRCNEWGWLSFQIYRRHFSGARRSTRDLGLLREMRDDCKAWLEQFEALADGHEAGWNGEVGKALGQNVSLFDSECGEIEKARAALSAADRARVLASVANSQFALWRVHFEGGMRRTRRVALLKRMIASLTEVLAGMEACRAEGVRTESNDGNIDKVRDRIAFFDKEQAAILSARASAAPAELAGNFGDEANALFNRYRGAFAGKQRSEVDAAALSEICDALYQVARQMDDLDRSYELPRNRENLDIVIDNLKRYEREHQAIIDAQRK